ncbi:hypothetical protein niasHT_015248 [Heterodera trifolii]|uniref:Gustatory receptor n=1 Tax=Heterodera trifolii TaxID=157864 RepID=A0ABD2L2F5_9BILA
MELFFFRHAEYERLYNCTGLIIDSVPLEQRQFVPESIVICILCTIYYVLYFPCIYSIGKHMRENSCYKMLFYIGITDLVNMFVLGYFSAWLSFRGAVFCSNPTLIYFAGMTVQAAKLFFDIRKNRQQFGTYISELDTLQAKTFVQVFLISLIHSLTGIIYVYLQYNEAHQWMITLAEFAWFHIHGFPPVIYWALNKTIREDCRMLYKKLFHSNRVSVISGVTVHRSRNTVSGRAASVIR